MVRRTLWLLVLVGGVLGFVGCMAATIGTWWMATRANHAAAKVLDRVGGVLEAMDRRTTELEGHLELLKVTTNDLVQAIEKGMELKVGERLATNPELREKLDRLTTGMERIELWMDVTEDSAQATIEMMQLIASSGARFDGKKLDDLQQGITKLRAKVLEAGELVDQVHDWINNEQGREEAARDSLRSLLAKVAVTLAPLDRYLKQLSQRVRAVGDSVAEAKATLRSRIFGVSALGMLALAWLGVGQAALCYLAWRGMRLSKALAHDGSRGSTRE